MSTPGERLRRERKRLGLSQEAFGALGGVRKQAQIKYEKDERKPNSKYLEAVAVAGVDVGYVLKGHEQEFREALEDVQAATEHALMLGGDEQEQSTAQAQRYADLREARRERAAQQTVCKDDREARLLLSFRKIPEEGKRAVEGTCFAIESASTGEPRSSEKAA